MAVVASTLLLMFYIVEFNTFSELHILKTQ